MPNFGLLGDQTRTAHGVLNRGRQVDGAATVEVSCLGRIF